MSILQESSRIREIMGINEEEEGVKMNRNLSKIIDTLTFLRLYSSSIEKMLKDISILAKDQIIDFDLMERGLRKRLLKKGDKLKNIEDYLGKIISSLKYRERFGYKVEPESEDYEFELEEPSIIPKKVFKKELYYLQVELLKLQEWLKETGKTVIVVFEGRDSAGKWTLYVNGTKTVGSTNAYSNAINNAVNNYTLASLLNQSGRVGA